MIIMKIHGGLGNQMFQYSLGRSLSLKLNTGLKLDVSSFEKEKKRNFELNRYNFRAEYATPSEIERMKGIGSLALSKASKYLPFLYGRSLYISEKRYGFDPRVLNLPDNRYLEGYWQSEKYFSGIEDKIKEEFKLKESADGMNLKMLSKISETPESVCLHVRRGDYVSSSTSSSFHGICDSKYYKKALDIIAEKIKKPSFFVFSDDLNWAKNNLPIGKNANYVDINSGGKGYEDLRLMSACKNFIVANSTFSWWGAWLGENQSKIVIAPKQWFRNMDSGDLIPEGWMRA